MKILRLFLFWIILSVIAPSSLLFGQGARITPSSGGGGRAIEELGITELIGINEVVSADQWSASVAITFNGTGEIRKVCLFATEDGAGAVFTAAGNLTLFDADPAITSNDATITAAERITIHAMITFAAADWESDANGASNCQNVNEVYSNGTLFAAWHSAAAETQWNSAAGDDEQLEVNFWVRRDS